MFSDVFADEVHDILVHHLKPRCKHSSTNLSSAFAPRLNDHLIEPQQDRTCAMEVTDTKIEIETTLGEAPQ